MKTLIPILISLLVVGCGKEQSTYTNDSNNTPQNSGKKNVEKETSSKDADNNSTWPVRKLTVSEEKLTGEYKHKFRSVNIKWILLENGIAQRYVRRVDFRSKSGFYMQKDEGDYTWKISEDGEIHFEDLRIDGIIYICSINKDDSFTMFASIDKDGNRYDYGADDKYTSKKIKSEPKETPSKTEIK